MVVAISSNGYIKRTPITEYPHAGGGRQGAPGRQGEDETRSSTCFVATPPTGCVFTNYGRSIGRKSTNCPNLPRRRGRGNRHLLQLAEGEQIMDCRAVRDFEKEGSFLVMATRRRAGQETAA